MLRCKNGKIVKQFENTVEKGTNVSYQIHSFLLTNTMASKQRASLCIGSEAIHFLEETLMNLR